MKQNKYFHERWVSWKLWLNTHPRKRWLVFGGAFLVLALIVAVLVWALTPSKPAPTPVPVKVSAPKPTVKYYSPLTGMQVDSEAATKQLVTAIMIENSPDARPQSGLKDAGVVYEAVAEAGITRFLALYQETKPQTIGPVRSVRLYYVDWLAPYDASVAHVGGSSAALAEVRDGSYRDIDQFFNAGSYWRATDRAAPHNVYTSFERLDALNAKKGYTSSEFQGFARSDKPTAGTTPATTIDVTISSALYNSSYSYDTNSGTYLRSEGGVAHNDREAGQLSPKVIVAMHVDMNRVMEDGYRENITTFGSGKAEIFQNGTVITGTWHKADRHSQLEFHDDSGALIKLARGQTWISAVPNNRGGVSWQ